MADLLYALGWAPRTGVVVVLFVQIFPQAKRRQIKRVLDSHEAAMAMAEQPSEQGKQKDQPKLGNTL